MVYVHSGPGFEALKEHIVKSYQAGNYPESWRNLPEVPSTSEIWSANAPEKNKPSAPEEWNEYQRDPEYSDTLPHNIIDGPWPSKEAYLGAHYQIIREDEIAPLRKSIADFKAQPDMVEDNETHIYTHVTFKGIMLSTMGPAFRIQFSTERAGKQIRWEQSKRLTQGTLVAISTHKDCFRKICKVAIIAARPLVGGLDQNPPQLDIFWGENDDAVFDPDEEYIMIEARTGFFEASRHMLVAMQKLMTESFSLANHIVDINPNVKAPAYVEDHSVYDLSPLIPEDAPTTVLENGMTFRQSLENVDILQDIPDIPESGMDPSQLAAFKSMLTKKVAIVQGPPGTGKTFVSVAALKIMLANLQRDEPPIIVSAQTNHALDQLLNHVLQFEPNIVRLGSRCDKGNKAILERTLYPLKQNNRKIEGMTQGLRSIDLLNAEKTSDIVQLLSPLLHSSVVSAETFLEYKIISQGQYDSLYDEGWAGEETSSGATGLDKWLVEDQRVHIIRTPMIDISLPLEEGEIEQEVAVALDQEARDDAEKDALRGTYVPFGRTFTGRDSGISDRDLKALCKQKKDLHAIPVGKRGDVYRYFLKRLGDKIRKDIKRKLTQYVDATNQSRLTRWSLNAHFIRQMGIKLIGCTTTGLSKFRGLLAAIQPRTLLIEEAAETKEGTIIGGMIESLQHLILVGDHQQLQANCNISSLEDAPYHMNVSMFERLVNNSIGYIMLNKQRRMVPNIRKLLTIEPAPFYKNLQDHHSVLDRKENRPPVPGMGDRDVWFFHHNWPEGRNPDSSRYNQDEAQFIAGQFKHLTMNGTDASKITVLTFYNGQRKRIIKELKSTQGLDHVSYFNVFTVDSFQGEENDVILLSLVRSNEMLTIGFLDNKNRLVVALSRARRGLYIFGNALTLTAAETNEDVFGRDALWDPLLQHLKRQKQFKFGAGFPVTCQRHGKTIEIEEPQDWAMHAGGCDVKCGKKLPCGHICPYRCHSFPESEVVCQQACPKKLVCGHGCSRLCGASCTCDQCQPQDECPMDDEISTRLSPPRVYYSSHDIRLDPVPQYPKPQHQTRSELFSPVNYPERIAEWNSWDAAKADREAVDSHRAEAVKSKHINTVYKERYIQTALDHKGTRVIVSEKKDIHIQSPQLSKKLNPAAQSFDAIQLPIYRQNPNFTEQAKLVPAPLPEPSSFGDILDFSEIYNQTPKSTEQAKRVPAPLPEPSSFGDLIDFSEPAVEVKIDRSVIPMAYLLEDLKFN